MPQNKNKYPQNLESLEMKKLGMVFTEEFISSFVVDRAFHYYIKGRDDKISALKNMKILEPSLGGGSFVFPIFNRVKNELNSKSMAQRFMIENFMGIDIEKTAIKLAKENIKELLETEDNQTKWKILEKDFLSLDYKEKFDIIIGNPPYIGEKGNKELFRKAKATEFGKKYYEKGMDYFYFFIEKSLELLNDRGILAFITPTYWTRADSAVKLRDSIRQAANFVEVIDFGEARIFKDACGHHSMIFILQKKKVNEFFHYTFKDNKKNLKAGLLSINEPKESTSCFEKLLCNNNFTMNFSPYFVFASEKDQNIINNIQKKSSYKLRDISSINQGIVSGADKVTVSNIKHIDETDISSFDIKKGDGIFVLNKNEVKQAGFNKDDSFIVPFYKNSSIEKYKVNPSELFLIYSTNKLKDEDKEKVTQYLSKYKSILQRRRECKNGSLPFYSLQWARKKEIFEGEKIVVPQRALVGTFAYHKGEFYASADVYFITDMKIDPFFLLGYLNSSLVTYYLKYIGKSKGSYLELYRRPLGEIPIPDFDNGKMKEISRLAKEIYYIKSNRKNCDNLSHKENEIEDLIWEMFELKRCFN